MHNRIWADLKEYALIVTIIIVFISMIIGVFVITHYVDESHRHRVVKQAMTLRGYSIENVNFEFISVRNRRRQ